MIAVEGVARHYGDRIVLPPLDLAVSAGTSLALVGPSGCGKSTLLRLIVGLLRPDRGRIVVDGTVVTPSTVLRVRQRTGYVIQSGGLFPHLTARDNVAIVARHLGWTAPRIAGRLDELAALVHIGPRLLPRYPAELSGGEQQRVGFMRALMLDPPVLLLDEPMGALDPMVRAQLREDLKRIFRDLGKTVLLVTHDLDEAAYLGDEIALMREGRIVQRGPIGALVDAPADAFVEAFVRARRPCPP